MILLCVSSLFYTIFVFSVILNLIINMKGEKNMTTFRVNHSEPFTNRTISAIYQTDAPEAALERAKNIVAKDQSLSSQKPDMLKDVLALDGYKMFPYKTEIIVNF